MTDSYSHIGDIREGLETAMTAARMEMLRIVVEELMLSLGRQNFRLNDLLEALVTYSERRADWSEVTKHLVQAANAVTDARQQLTDK